VNLLGLSCRENSSFQHNHFSGGLPLKTYGYRSVKLGAHDHVFTTA
jgi:hypothetical protein